MPIEQTYPTYPMNYEELAELMADKAVNMMDGDKILCRITLNKGVEE
jgi:hypothetical protein